MTHLTVLLDVFSLPALAWHTHLALTALHVVLAPLPLRFMMHDYHGMHELCIAHVLWQAVAVCHELVPAGAGSQCGPVLLSLSLLACA